MADRSIASVILQLCRRCGADLQVCRSCGADLQVCRPHRPAPPIGIARYLHPPQAPAGRRCPRFNRWVAPLGKAENDALRAMDSSEIDNMLTENDKGKLLTRLAMAA